MQDVVLRRLWRQRWLALAVIVVATATAAVISTTLPPVYSTSAKLLVASSSDDEFGAIQAAQVTARTYSNVLSSSNIAELVSVRLQLPRADVAGAIDVRPVPETQLLEIRAEGPTPRRAKLLGDAYADVFVEYARQSLAPTTRANVTVADRAPLPGAPARPRPALYTALAFLLAVPVAAGLALLRDRLDQRVRDPSELERRFDVPVLALVPRRGRGATMNAAFAESLRMLRTAVQYSGSGRPPRTLAITSALEKEGKTTVTHSLALAAVEAGQRVIAVEADVYKPQLYRQLAGEDPDPTVLGLTSYLAGAAQLDDVLRASRTPGLIVMPAGPQPPSFLRLLETERGRSLADSLLERADLVLFDLPPLEARSDAAVLAARTAGVVMVTDLRMSTLHRLQGAMRQLETVGARLLGWVVNRDSSTRPTYYDHQRPDSLSLVTGHGQDLAPADDITADARRR